MFDLHINFDKFYAGPLCACVRNNAYMIHVNPVISNIYLKNPRIGYLANQFESKLKKILMSIMKLQVSAYHHNYYITSVTITRKNSIPTKRLLQMVLKILSITKEVIWKEGKLCLQVVPDPPDVNPLWRCVLVRVVNFITTSTRR